MLVELTGKTNHGKNRVREHGKLWNVQDLPTGVLRMHPMPKQKVMISVLTDDERWVNMVNDPNFSVRIIK